MASGNGTARRRIAALGLVMALLATTACGSRWSAAERASVYARGQGTGGAAAGQGSAGSAVTPGSTVPGAAVAGGTTGGTGGSTGTTGGSVGGTTGSVASGGPGARACAAPSTAPGVTPSTVTVGTINTLSGPLPGLGETSAAAVRSYVAYRNATGGVCGRQIVLKSADDGFDNSRFRSLVTDFNTSTLGIAGGLASGDGGGVDVVQANNYPVVATATADSYQYSPVVFDINPPFANIHAVIGKYRWLYDHGVRTAALVYIDNAIVKTQVEQQKAQMQAVGIKIVNEQALPLSTLSYDAAARGVANSKADYLFYPAAGNLNVTMARAMHDTGYKLKYQEYITAYGSNFIPLAGAAAEGVVTWIRALPNEERGSNAEQSAYLDWMTRVAPGITADTFAADAWAAAKAFLDNLDALPGPISRAALLTQLRSVATYDGGGFFGPIQLGKHLSNGCVVGMQVVGGKWTRIAPDHGFLC